MSKASLIELPFTRVLKSRIREKEPLMQFVLGPRQVGKTTGVEMALVGAERPIHYVLVEDHPDQSSEWLKHQWYYAESLGEGAVLVIDEIQKINGWSNTLKFLWDSNRKNRGPRLCCIFLGSSSLNINQGLAESLAGRYEVLVVPHWDYETSKKLVPQMSFSDFLKYGGYPGSYRFLSDPRRWLKYIRASIIENVLTKDILSLKTIKKPGLFRQLVELLAAYPSQEVSYTKLLGQLQESGNVEIIKHYISLLQDSYLFWALEKFSAKKVLQKASSPKIVPMCPAIIEALAPEVPEGRRFESYIGSQLVHQGGQLFYWRDRNYEVDFVYKSTRAKTVAIEVKSGKKKHSASLTKFLEQHRSVKPLIIDQKNMSLVYNL